MRPAIWVGLVLVVSVLAWTASPETNERFFKSVGEKLMSTPWMLTYQNSSYGQGSPTIEEQQTEIEECFENGLVFEQSLVKLRCAGGRELTFTYSLSPDLQGTTILEISDPAVATGSSWSYEFDVALPLADRFTISRRTPDQMDLKRYFVFKPVPSPAQ